jgi:hypothetical protein
MISSKHWSTWLFLLASALAGGCLVQSLRPFYGKETVACPQAEGLWTPTRDFGRSVTNPSAQPWSVTYSTNRAGKYSVSTVMSDSAVTSNLEVTFFSAGGRTYCDISAELKSGENKYWNAVVERVHMLGRVDFTNDTMKVELLNRNWMQNARTNGTVTLDAVSRGRKALLITDQDFNWEKFLETHGDTPGVFSTNAMFEFRRK